MGMSAWASTGGHSRAWRITSAKHLNYLGCKLPWMNAVSADEVRQLDQKLPEPGILLKQRLSFVGTFVTTRSIPFKGISK